MKEAEEHDEGWEESFDLYLADVPVRVEARSSFVAEICRPYVADFDPVTPLTTIRVSEGDLAYERSIAPGFADPYLESCAVHRAAANALAPLDRVVFHSCVVEYCGRAYAFTAPSGTGKSTHAGLWVKFLGGNGARVLNGDKPLVHAPGEGDPVAFGSPWTGKEGWGYNGSAPLAGICVLHQALSCSIERLSAVDAVGPVMRQCYIPRDDSMGTLSVLRCVDRLLVRVPVWSMGCDISQKAVKASFEAMTGEDYLWQEDEE